MSKFNIRTIFATFVILVIASFFAKKLFLSSGESTNAPDAVAKSVLTPEQKTAVKEFMAGALRPSSNYRLGEKYVSIIRDIKYSSEQLLAKGISEPDKMRSIQGLQASRFELETLRGELKRSNPNGPEGARQTSLIQKRIDGVIALLMAAEKQYSLGHGTALTSIFKDLSNLQVPQDAKPLKFIGRTPIKLPEQRGTPPKRTSAYHFTHFPFIMALAEFYQSEQGNATEILPCHQSFFTDPLNAEAVGSDYLNYSKPEFDLTPEMIALAQSLAKPYQVFKYAQNQIQYEMYVGAAQSAHSVYLRKSGSPADQATFLVGMLRAAGIPARYVIGDTLVSENQLMNLWQLENTTSVYNVHLALFPYLEKLRNTTRWVNAGGQTYYILPHVWVEAFVPLNAQRGNGLTTGIKSWIPMDPSFDNFDVVPHAVTAQNIESAAAASNLKLFDRDAYLLSKDPSTGKVLKTLNADQSLISNVVSVLSQGISQGQNWAVPFSQLYIQGNLLPNAVEGITVGPNGSEACPFRKVAFLPSDQKIRVRVQVDGIDTIISGTDIGLKSIYVAYKGATAADENNLQLISNGGSTTASIKVIPNLYADDSILAAGSSVTFGTATNITPTILGPPEASYFTLAQSLNSGQPIAILTGFRQDSTQNVSDTIGRLTALLQNTNAAKLTYYEKSRVTGKILAAAELILNQKAEATRANITAATNTVAPKTSDFAIMSAGLAPNLLGDRMFGFVPQKPFLSWVGSGYTGFHPRAANYFFTDPNFLTEPGRVRANQVASVAFSQLEHQIFEDFFSIPSQSTIKVIQEAGDSAAPMISATVTAANLNSVLSSFKGYSALSINTYRSDINLLGLGGKIIAPVSPVYVNGSRLEVMYYATDAGAWSDRIGGALGGLGGAALPDTTTGVQPPEVPTDLNSQISSYTPSGSGADLGSDYSAIFGSPGSPAYIAETNDLANGGGEKCNPTSSVGCPVDLSTGSMWHTFTDLTEIQGPGPRLSFSRTYSAQASYSGPLGFGWTHNFNFRIETADGSPLDITKVQNLKYFDARNNPSLIVFVNGKPVMQPWMRMKLLVVAKANEYRITLADATIYRFIGSGPARGKISSITDRLGNGMGFNYDGLGRLTTITDSIGRTMTFNYDSSSRIIQVADFSGRAAKFVYDARGDLITSTDIANNSTNFTYLHDQIIPALNHNMASFRDPNGNGVDYYYYSNDKVFKHIESTSKQTTYVYNTYTKETSVYDALGRKKVYSYDVLGNLIRITNPDSTFVARKYDIFRNKTEDQDEDGFVTKFTSDQAGNTTAITPQAPFGSTKITYNPTFNVPTSIVDGNGNLTTYAIDQSGNILSESKYKDNSKTHLLVKQYTYYPNGELKSETDANGGVTQYLRSLDGQFNESVTITDPSGAQAFQSYDPLGRLVSSVDFAGLQTNFVYDSFGRILSSSVPNDVAHLFGYDKVGNLISEQRSAGGRTIGIQHTYDGLGNLTSTTNELGETTYFNFINSGCNCAIPGQVVSKVDAKGNRTEYQYDFRGKPTRIADPRGSVSILTYDGRGNVNQVKVSDLSGNILFATRSSFGPLNKVTDSFDIPGFSPSSPLWRDIYKNGSVDTSIRIPEAGADIVHTIFNYDKAGNLSAKVTQHSNFGTDAGTEKISYVYSPVNALLSKTFQFSSSSQAPIVMNGFTYSYDDNLNLTQVTNNDSNLQMQYDALNRMTVAKTTPVAGAAAQAASQLTYSYDPMGRVKSISDSDGSAVVSYNYDNLFRMNSVKAGSSSVAIGYDSFGRRNSIGFSNGLSTVVGFNDADRVTSISTPNVLTMRFGYDKDGNINDLKSDIGEWKYSYDQSNWLIGSMYKGSGQVSNETYVWDSSGNQITGNAMNLASFSSTAGLNLKRPLVYNNMLLEDALQASNAYGVGLYAYAYDFKGNMSERYNNVTDEHLLYAYDAENHLIQVRSVDLQNNVINQADFKYDGLGRRISKRFTSAGSVNVTSYIYDRQNILFEYDGSNTRHATYLGTGEVDNHLLMIRDGAVHFYHTDQLGSTIAMTDSLGKVEEQISYSSFGAINNFSVGPTRSPASISSGVMNPFYFAGREFDQETGLYYSRARYYDPGTGRFTSSDPLKFASGDSNFYRYTLNNPLNGVDPSGLDTLQLGFSYNLSLGPIVVQVGTGIAVDTHGGFGTYTYGGGGGSAGSGSGSGVSFAYSNANTIQDLSGPFNNVSYHAGNGVGGSVDVFSGLGSQGQVVEGFGATLGVQVGASANLTNTNTGINQFFGNQPTQATPVQQSQPTLSCPRL